MSVNCLVLTHKKRYLVSGSDDWTIRVWDTDTVQEINNMINVEGAHRSIISCLAISHRDELFSGSYDKTVK